MTLEEVCKKYDRKPDTLKNQFNREQKAILNKYGVKIIKEGRGNKATYREEIQSDMRAVNIFEANDFSKGPGFMKSDLSLPNFTFNVFMGVITTPMFVFRGTYNELLGYIGKPLGEDSEKALKNSINELVNMMILHEIIDTTNEGEEVITLSLVRKAEVEMKLGITMARNCKELADKNGINDWINVAKVWIATELLSKQGAIYTVSDIIKVTGLSPYMVKKVSGALKYSNIYKTTKAYTGFQQCIGQSADFNVEGFFDIKKCRK